MTITANFEHFHYFNFQTSFLKKKKNFKEKLVHCFFVESTTTENPKTYVKTDRMENKKWIYPKKLNFPLTTLFFENLICV